MEVISRSLITSGFMSLALLMTSCCSAPNKQYHQMVRSFRNSNCKVDVRSAEEYVLNEPLERSNLVGTVLIVNPSLESVRQAWGTMLAKYPQVISWDDPLASYALAPGTIHSKKVAYGQQIDLRQKFPFPGKLGLKGKIALAEAGSAEEDYEWVKIQLATAASNLFDDYYLIERAIEINHIHIALLKEYKESANAQYATSRVTLQIPLQAEVELAQLEYEQISLATDREVIIAKINALLHRDPSTPLPPPPKALHPIAVYETEEQLQQVALQNRPDLHAIQAKIDAAETTLRLAHLEYLPDFEVSGTYNTMWPFSSMYTMLGVGFNLPIQLERRQGAVDEASTNIKSLSYKLDQLVDQTFVEVTTALKRVSQAREYVEILQEEILPTAKDELEAAIAGFEAGKNTFLELIESERTLRTLELQLHSALAEFYRQLAMLDQAVGYISHFSEERTCYE
jgi:outer membrane protein TolC